MLINHLVILWIQVSNEKVKFIFRSREWYTDNITIVNSNGTISLNTLIWIISLVVALIRGPGNFPLMRITC